MLSEPFLRAQPKLLEQGPWMRHATTRRAFARGSSVAAHAGTKLLVENVDDDRPAPELERVAIRLEAQIDAVAANRAAGIAG
jgi:hypothetical protein